MSNMFKPSAARAERLRKKATMKLAKANAVDAVPVRADQKPGYERLLTRLQQDNEKKGQR